MITPTDLREIHGPVFVSEVADGTIIPWHPLSLGEFLEYQSLFATGFVDHSILENEIFAKCVTDPVLVNNIHIHKAGTVSAVAAAIMANSNIEDKDVFNTALDNSRRIAQHPIHQFVSLICRAFPGYTPDDIYAMDFATFLLRLAQAEEKLLMLGGISEPIRLETPDDQRTMPAEPKSPEKKDYKIDPKKIKEAFDLKDAPAPKKLNLSNAREEEDLDLGSTEDGKPFIVSTNLMALGLEVGDDDQAKQMQQDAKALYGDYLKQGNKVKIKTVDERLADFEARQKRRKQKTLEAAKKKKQTK